MDQEVKLYECYSCKRRDYMNNLFPMNYIVKEVNCDLAGISLVTTNIRAVSLVFTILLLGYFS